MDSRSFTHEFLSSLLNGIRPDQSLLLSISDANALSLPSADTHVHGFDWRKSVKQNARFGFIAVDLPIGMGREKTEIGDAETNVRKNWAELAAILRSLDVGGYCVALVEPSAFGLAEGPAFLSALETEGFGLAGIFNTPPNLLDGTRVRPVLVVLRKAHPDNVFLAELEDGSQAAAIARAFLQQKAGSSLHSGIYLDGRVFDGFSSLKAKLHLEKLESQYNDYSSVVLGELAEEINSVRSGEVFVDKENSIYIPKLGKSAVTHDLSSVSIKHHNLFQVVLPEKARSKYVSAFFRSELGTLILQAITQGAVIPKINKSCLTQARIALPPTGEQDVIVQSHDQLHHLLAAIDTLQKELALNPRNAPAIRSQVEKMLDQIGELTDADRVLSLAREGESATTEFKQTFSMDIRDGKKGKHVELSALKTVVAFLNTDGGVLLIGVNDTGNIPGLGKELKLYSSTDRFLLHFKNRLKTRIGEQFYPYIEPRIVDVADKQVLMVECSPSSKPCFLDGSDFYVRTNPATDKLEGQKLIEYVENHFQR